MISLLKGLRVIRVKACAFECRQGEASQGKSVSETGIKAVQATP